GGKVGAECRMVRPGFLDRPDPGMEAVRTRVQERAALVRGEVAEAAGDDGPCAGNAVGDRSDDGAGVEKRARIVRGVRRTERERPAHAGEPEILDRRPKGR